MKELAAILLGVVLVAAGWNQPYRDHYLFLAGTLAKAGISLPTKSVANVNSGQVVSTTQAPQTDNSWMWRKGSLDSAKQSGVDRSGVHTFEPMLK